MKMHNKHRLIYNTKPWSVFVLTLISSLVVAGLFIKSHLRDAYAVERSTAKAVAENHAALVNITVANSMSANYALAAMVRQFAGDTFFFDAYAQELKLTYPDVSHFSLSPNGIITHVYPLRGNEGSIGLNQLEFPAQKQEAQRAKETASLTVAGPISLVQGGVAIVGRLPIWLEIAESEAVFWGFSNVTVRLEPLLSNAKLLELVNQGYHYKLVKLGVDNQREIVSETGSFALETPVFVDIKVANGLWQLELSPQQGWLNQVYWSEEVILPLLIAVLIASLSALLVRLSQGKYRLERQVRQRTRELQKAHSRLIGLFEAIPDLLFEIDREGVVLHCHAPRPDLLYSPIETVIGYNISEQLPEEAVAVYRAAFAEAMQKGYSFGKTFALPLKNAKTHWFELSLSLAQHSKSADVSFVALSRDITSRVEAEAELRIAATAFEAQDGILITDAEQRIVRVNSAFKRITGYSEAEVLGQTPAILNSGRHDQEFYAAMYRRLEKEGFWEGEIWNRKKDGSIYPELLTISAVYDPQHQLTHYIATLKDISQNKRHEQTINQLSFYDSLTGLPNRRLISERIDSIIDLTHSEKFASVLLFIDLDNFKNVNDTMGHPIGDQLLQDVAKRLLSVIRSTDMVARFGGDEFLVLLESVDISADPDRAFYRAEHVAEKINTAMQAPFNLNGERFLMSLSIGITAVGRGADRLSEVLKQAELAMYEAKAQGRNQICFYAPQMQEKILARMALEADLREALQHAQFRLHYQPQFDRLGQLQGVEALLRWQHPERGMVSPMTFIPVAEESKLILPIGRWVLETACRLLAQWQPHHHLQHLVVSVNVSALQFLQADFVSQVEDCLRVSGAQPARLQLELTESMLVNDKDDIIEKMQALKALGILISLDDFGTGYSSLSYLQKLPLDQLKIDRSFIASLDGSDDSASLALTITTMGHSLGLEVIAEGVETQQQLDILKGYRCDLFQGYFTGYPVDAQAIERMAYDAAMHVIL